MLKCGNILAQAHLLASQQTKAVGPWRTELKDSPAGLGQRELSLVQHLLLTMANQCLCEALIQERKANSSLPISPYQWES